MAKNCISCTVFVQWARRHCGSDFLFGGWKVLTIQRNHHRRLAKSWLARWACGFWSWLARKLSYPPRATERGYFCSPVHSWPYHSSADTIGVTTLSLTHACTWTNLQMTKIVIQSWLNQQGLSHGANKHNITNKEPQTNNPKPTPKQEQANKQTINWQTQSRAATTESVTLSSWCNLLRFHNSVGCSVFWHRLEEELLLRLTHLVQLSVHR